MLLTDIQAGRLDKAIEAIRQRSDLQDRPELRELLACLLFRHSFKTRHFHPETSLQMCEEASTLLPEEMVFSWHVGVLSLRLRRFEKAKLAFERCLSTSPKDNRIRLHLAVACFGLGQTEEARALASSVPQDRALLGKKARVLLSACLGRQGQWQECLETIGLGMSPREMPAVRIMSGLAALALGHLDQVSLSVGGLLEKRPTSLLYAPLLGLYAAQSRLYGQAMEWLSLCEDTPLSRRRLIAVIARAHRIQEEFQEIVRLLLQARSRMWSGEIFRNAAIWEAWNRGFYHYVKGHTEEAWETLGMPFRLSSDAGPPALGQLFALVAEDADVPEEAVAGWRMAIKGWKMKQGLPVYSRPEVLAAAHQRMSRLCVMLGLLDQGLTELHRGQKLLASPSKKMTDDEAAILHLMRRPEEAWKLIQGHVSEEARPGVLCLYASIAFGIGSTEEAKRLWQKALAVPEENQEVKGCILGWAEFELDHARLKKDKARMNEVRAMMRDLLQVDMSHPGDVNDKKKGYRISHMSDALGLPPFLCEPIDRALREVAVETEEFSPRGFKDLASQITLSHGRTPALSSLALAIVASWVLDHGGRMSKTRADLIAMLAIRAARSETEMKDLLRFILLCMPNLVHVTVLRSVLNGYPNLMEAHLLVLLRTRNVKEARTRLAACQYLARTNEDREILHHVTELHPHRFPRS